MWVWISNIDCTNVEAGLGIAIYMKHNKIFVMRHLSLIDIRNLLYKLQDMYINIKVGILLRCTFV